jgi:hypothetical protein
MTSGHALPQSIVSDGIQAALTHLMPQTAAADEDLGYEPVPPRREIAVAIELRVTGRGTPLPYLG